MITSRSFADSQSGYVATDPLDYANGRRLNSIQTPTNKTSWNFITNSLVGCREHFLMRKPVSAWRKRTRRLMSPISRVNQAVALIESAQAATNSVAA